MTGNDFYKLTNCVTLYKLTKSFLRPILLILSVLCVWGGQYALSAQPSSSSEYSSIEIYFRSGSSEYLPRFRSNAASVSRFVESTNALARSLETGRVKITFSACASPEGGAEINARLSEERLRSAAAALTEAGLDPGFFDAANISSASFTGTVPLAYLAEMTENSSFKFKSGILGILEDDDLDDEEKISRLRTVEGGRCWTWLERECFPKMRSFRAVVRIERSAVIAKVESSQAVGSFSVAGPSEMEKLAPRTERPDVTDEALAAEETAEGEWTRRLTLKTNVLGLSLLLANAAAEIGITEHLTFHLPIYYSAVNYFTQTVKFRTLAAQPELRYYIPKVSGLFAGAHFSVASFNFAVGGDYRIQDRGGNTPMLGGGLSIGYRMQFRDAPRLGMEFSIGAGAYRFDYDRFVNEPNGPYVDTVNKTYIGIDNLSVSVTYDFDLGNVKRKKEGRR